MTTEPRCRLAGPKARVLSYAVALALLSVATLVPSAAAQPDVVGANVNAGRIEIGGPTTENGKLDLLYVRQFDQLSAAKLPTLSMKGDTVDVTTYNVTGYEVSTGLGVYEDTKGATCQEPAASNGAAVGCPEVWTILAKKADMDLVGVQELYILNVFGSGFVHKATYSSATITAVADPHLGPAGIDDLATASQPTSDQPDTWTHPQVAGYHLDTVLANGASTIHIEGNFVIEVLGVDFQLKQGNEKQIVHSGTDRTALVAGGPDQVRSIKETFMRITVTNGKFDLTIHNPATEVEWTGPSAELDTQGTVSLQQASGSVRLADASTTTVDDETVDATGANGLALATPAPTIPVAMTKVDPAGQAVTPGTSMMTPELAFVLAGITALVVALGATVFFVARRTRAPILADVEAAIEAGRYRRAAADAGRILRRRPDMEDAVLSRAIALSKAGKAQRVVRELTAHLRVRSPSDGSLQYVLGLAYLDLGRRGEAEAAFDAALRRTPSLLTDVQAKLGATGTTSRTPGPLEGPESPHGYA